VPPGFSTGRVASVEKYVKCWFVCQPVWRFDSFHRRFLARRNIEFLKNIGFPKNKVQSSIIEPVTRIDLTGHDRVAQLFRNAHPPLPVTFLGRIE
jgi:hypothetical protein